MRPRDRLLVLALAASTALFPGCSSPEPKNEQREVVVKTRGADEAFDALSQALLQRFDGVDPAGTSRTEHTVATTWRAADEPDRLVRKRARGSARWLAKDETALVEVAVERQISTKKTSFGELDRQNPVWVGDLADTTLEREILKAVEARTAGGVR